MINAEKLKRDLYKLSVETIGEDDLRGVIKIFARINNISLKGLKEEIDFILNYEDI